MPVWLLTAVQYSDREMTEVKAYAAGQVEDPANLEYSGVRQGQLKTPKEIAKLISGGQTVLATWLDADGRTLAQMVGAVPMPDGTLGIEAISQGAPADRKLSDLPDVDQYFFDASRVPGASIGQLESAAFWMKHYSTVLDKALKLIKADSKKSTKLH